MDQKRENGQEHLGPILTIGTHVTAGLLVFLLVLVISAGASTWLPARLGRRYSRGTPAVEHVPPRGPVILSEERGESGALRTLVALPAQADAYIASERAGQNFGVGPLYLGYNLDGDHFGAQRMLLYFDVTSIPVDAVVHDATLHLRVSSFHPAKDDPMPTIIRCMASSWAEQSVTWNTEPTWGEIRAHAPVGSALDWYEWNLTSLVADWVDEAHVNDGIEIIGDERVRRRERVFYSRETGTDLFPRLIVDYTRLDDLY